MSVPDSRCILVVTPDDHVIIGFHEVMLHDMEDEDLPFVTLSELGCLRLVWPKTSFVFMSRYQHDLECMRKECSERFGSMLSGNCTHCGKYIQQNLGKHVALYHIELAQLWRCLVTWCTVWKGTAQDCVDHMRRTHDAPLAVKAANLGRYFPPWTVTREQWSTITHPSISGVAIDTLLFSRIGSPLFHCYRIISRTGTHAAFWGTYMRRLHAFREESDSAAVRWQHRRCAKDNTDVAVIRSGLRRQNGGCSFSSHSLSPGPGDLVSRRGGLFFQAVGIGWSASVGGIHCTNFDGFGAPSVCGVGRHLPWSVSSASPASLAACRLDTSGQEDLGFPEDQVPVSSSIWMSLSDLSITLLCDSDEVLTPVNSDQVLSDVDLLLESVVHDKRQVIRIRDVSPDALLVDGSQVGRASCACSFG